MTRPVRRGRRSAVAQPRPPEPALAPDGPPRDPLIVGDPGLGKAIVSDADLARIVDRMAHQILEKTDGGLDSVLLGIPTRGVPLARRLATRIHAFEGIEVPGGVLDITLYPADLRLRAARPI